MRYVSLLFLFFQSLCFGEASPSTRYVTVRIHSQLGNQMFEIATAYAYALDHEIPLLVPGLLTETKWNVPFNYERLFSGRLDTSAPSSPPSLSWKEPSFNYHPLPEASSLALSGFFQSEKYFKHRRKEILELFAPPEGVCVRLKKKYPFLQSDTLVVGIQIRDYRKEFPTGAYHPTKTRSYFAKAIEYFPEDAIFLVSSNNQALAKECTWGLRPNIVYLEENYIDELYALSLCNSFIISNSSFGWWAYWLSTSPDKVLIAPRVWFAPDYNNEAMIKDLYPEGCIVLDD